MKNQKIISIIFCIAILVTTFLGIETATGIKAENSAVYKDNDYVYATNIDANIHLFSKHLPLFRKSLGYINDSEIRGFIQQIINLLEVKGKVDSSDIEEIVNNLNLNTKIKGIHFLCFLKSSGSGFAYARGVISFVFDFIFENLFDETYIGPAILVEWVSPDADTYINNNKIYDDDSQKGYIFGFLGLTSAGGTWPTYYTVIGFSTFVIIAYSDL